MQLQYERPQILTHSAGMPSKFGGASVTPTLRAIDGVPVSELVEAYGSPLFVFSERTLRERITELRDQMARRFSDFVIAWSYKTNYLGAVCKVFHQEGAWAEVVSGMELQKALLNGVPGSQILFNGPSKSADDLKLAFTEGAHVHIDHLDELALAERVATAMNVTPSVTLRLNIAELPTPTWDRFGFNLENGAAAHAVRRITRGGRLQLTGLHCHIGTFVLNADAYRMQARAMARFARKLWAEHGIRIESLDFGGGFASKNTLREQYLPGEEVAPSFGQYVRAIAQGLDEGLDGAEPPRVIFETGRALVDDAGSVVSTVLGTKHLIDGRRAVIIDAGVNILPTAWWYKHTIVPELPPQGVAEPTVFVGPLCMNIDVIRETSFPPLSAGDRIVVRHAGAYNVTQWMQFITLRPVVAMVSPDGRHAPIRVAESVQTLVEPERLPPWLG